MSTWDEAAPPDLAPPGFLAKVVGVMRIFGLIAVTMVLISIFLIGRFIRRRMMPAATLHFRTARLWSRICLLLAGLRLRVQGRPIAAGALVANHASWIDILPLRSTRTLHFVSKDDVKSWNYVGWIARVVDTVFIERRRSAAKQQEEMLRARIRMGQVLCFFPEGTSTDGSLVLPFKSSLFSAFMDDEGHGAELYIQPVTVRYLPREGMPRNFYAWWGTMPFGRHVWDIVTRSFGGRVEVIFHEPVRPSTFPDRKALADHCQREVSKGLHEGIV